MPKQKKMCFVCGKRPPKKLKSIYAHAIPDAVFCSKRCAAEYGLLKAGDTDNCTDINWCKNCGWFEGWLLYEGCPEAREGGNCDEYRLKVLEEEQ